MRKTTLFWGSVTLAYMFLIGLLAACATPAILVDPSNPPDVEPCPRGFVDTSFPTSGKLRCEAPEGIETHAMRPAP